jgi:hypothetical protein
MFNVECGMLNVESGKLNAELEKNSFGCLRETCLPLAGLWRPFCISNTGLEGMFYWYGNELPWYTLFGKINTLYGKYQ